MNPIFNFLGSSLGKKILMALTGFIWAGFVLGHMVGNLQIFLDPYYINAYGYKLHHLPYGLLWVIRVFLLVALVVHVMLAISLTRANRAARPERYKADGTIQASLMSRTMIYSGSIILAFFLFHIAHFTVRAVPGQEFNESIYMADGTEYPAMVPLEHNGKVYKDSVGGDLIVHDVHTMMVAGFSRWWVSVFYLIGVGLLCAHLMHGVSSMFQSLGLRNANWRKFLDRVAIAYGIVVFAGFASIPVGVLAGIVNVS